MIGRLMMCVSAVILILLAGMLAGIVMDIKQDFARAPARPHLNLVGGVNGESLVAIPIAGSLIVVAATALFAVIVFRTAAG
jgi:hypothetical protein